MKTILALLFAGGTLVLAQLPPATNNALPAIPPLPQPTDPTAPLPALPQGGAAPGVNAPNFPLPAARVPQPDARAEGGVAAAGAAGTAVQAEEINYGYEAADQDVLFDEYALLVGRSIIRGPTTPQFKATFKTQAPLTRAEAIQAFEAIFSLNGVVAIPWGEKFVKIGSSAASGTAGAEFHMLDSTNVSLTADLIHSNVPPTARYLVQIVQLKYAKPSEMIEVLRPYALIQGGIQAIDSSGILIIRDHAQQIQRMMELIKMVDVTSLTATVDPEIIPIKYALAEDIASVLSSLTTGGGGGTTVGRAAGATGGTSRAGGRRGGLSSTTSGGYGPGGLQPGAAGALGAARAGGAGAAPAAGASFAQRLQNIVDRAGGDIQVLGEVKIIADARTNSLLIFAGREDMQMIKKIVDKIDVVLAQVLIEAIVMEVSLDDSLDYGVSAAQNPRNFTDRITGGGGINNGQAFLSAATNAFTGSLADGFSYFGKIGADWNVAVRAIAKDGTINVLSRPRIQTSHAKQAVLQVGDTVPYVTGTYFGGGFSGNGQSSSQYQQTFVGIEIEVMPLINPDGLVIMDIQQVNIEQLGTPTRIDGNDVPTTSKRFATANVAVRDGETIILGGFISSSRSKSKSGVPILKDIPFLGGLFSSTGKKNKRVELIVLMRPTVLKTPEIAAQAARDETAKLPGVRGAVRDFEEENEARMRQAGPEPALFRSWIQRTNAAPVAPLEVLPDGTH